MKLYPKIETKMDILNTIQRVKTKPDEKIDNLDVGLVLQLDNWKKTPTVWSDHLQYNNGVVTDASIVNLGYSFNGTSDYVTVTPSVASFFFPASGAQTVSVWFNSTDTSVSRQQFAYPATGSPGNRVYIVHDVTNLTYVIGTASNTIKSNTIWPLNTWHNVIIVRDIDNLQRLAYFNGQLAHSSSLTNINTALTTPTLFIGSQSASSTFHKGMMGEVRIWNRRLIDDEPLKYYLKTKGAYGL